jgi:hypothetical protein
MPYDKWNPDYQGDVYPFYLGARLEDSGKQKKLACFVHGAGAHFNKWMGAGNQIINWNTDGKSDYYRIYFDDPVLTWHFGFADRMEKNMNPGDTVIRLERAAAMEGSTVKNYTEYRNWCAIRWMISGQAPWLGDKNEVTIAGHSMGGTGSVTWSLHHPEIFAYIEGSSEGINNWVTVGDNPNGGDPQGLDWFHESAKFGRGKNLACHDLISIDKLIDDRDVGMSAMGWQSPRDSVIPLLEGRDDLTFMNFNHGTRDGIIPWLSQGMPIWSDHTDNMYAKYRMPYSGAWVNAGHGNQGGKGANPSGCVPKNHFILALGSATSDDALEDSCTVWKCEDFGSFNARVRWSTERSNIGEPPMDSPMIFETTVKLETGTLAASPTYNGPAFPTVDITPRRLQQLIHTPGTQYAWENIPAGGGAPIQSGTLTADAKGLFTVPAFQFSAAGNKLRVEVTKTVNNTVSKDNRKGTSDMLTVYPNPFSTGVEVSFLSHNALVKNQNAKVEIYDISGKLLTDALCIMHYDFGIKARWSAQNQPNGVYLVKIKTGKRELVKRIVLAR